MYFFFWGGGGGGVRAEGCGCLLAFSGTGFRKGRLELRAWCWI